MKAIDVHLLAEDSELEVKKAAGKDGQGALPADFWRSYSAMANTDGGVILLGVEQKGDGSFSVAGIQNPSKVQKSLWDGLNDRRQISANLLTNQDVERLDCEGKTVLKVTVPRARRWQRPVYSGANPLTGTYRRNYEGDYRCDEETVRRMLAEQVEDDRDGRLLDGFGIQDLDPETLKVYRNQFRSARPDHVWLDLDDQEFLRCLGAWARDRQTGREGLTLAGLLMFGKLPSILEALPNYVVDYQERPEPRAELRWVDRLTTDGTWSGNLYDFYRLVARKLYQDLKIPFLLRGGRRVDESPVHEALREALVNTLIHADYTGRVSVLVVRRPDLFGFRNPGTMRLPLEEALRGGTSDCRNRRLQKMFQLAGLAEQAGSGIPKIYKNWQDQHWRPPQLVERTTPDQTLLTLSMVSLLSEETLHALDSRFGTRARQLPPTPLMALAIVAAEGLVTHGRLRPLVTDHPHDISTALAMLCREGFLESAGSGRGKLYFFPGDRPERETDAAQEELFGSPSRVESERPLGDDSVHLHPDSVHLQGESVHLHPDSVHLQGSSVQSGMASDLDEISRPIRERGKAPRREVEEAIASLCRGRYLSLKQLSLLLQRSEFTVRHHYLAGMIADGRIVPLYPETPNHPGQVYRTRDEASPGEAATP